MIGPAVDQERRRSAPGALRHGILDGRGDRARSPMGQGEDDDVVSGEVTGIRGLHEPVRQGHQVRMVLSETVARRGVRRDGADLDIRMSRKKAENLAPGVPGRSSDCCCPRHTDDHTSRCIEIRPCGTRLFCSLTHTPLVARRWREARLAQ